MHNGRDVINLLLCKWDALVLPNSILEWIKCRYKREQEEYSVFHRKVVSGPSSKSRRCKRRVMTIFFWHFGHVRTHIKCKTFDGVEGIENTCLSISSLSSTHTSARQWWMLDHNTLDPGNQCIIVMHVDSRFMSPNEVVGKFTKSLQETKSLTPTSQQSILWVLQSCAKHSTQVLCHHGWFPPHGQHSKVGGSIYGK
jgi:hypothetical protein